MVKADLTELLCKHPFVGDLHDAHLKLLVGCAKNVHFRDGQFLCHEGEAADLFFLIRSGRVAIEIHSGHKGKQRIQTIGPGEVLGWSWLIFPYRWHFDGCAVSDVSALALDGKCLRTKCDKDHDFGYEMLKRLANVFQSRMEATRLQLLDVYGTR